MKQVISEINQTICTPPISLEALEDLLGTQANDVLGWQEILIQVDPKLERLCFRGVDVWYRKEGKCEKLLSSPNYQNEMTTRNDCPWENIRAICETVLTVCGERLCVPLVRLIQGKHNSQLYLLRTFDYHQKHWLPKTFSHATPVKETE